MMENWQEKDWIGIKCTRQNSSWKLFGRLKTKFGIFEKPLDVHLCTPRHCDHMCGPTNMNLKGHPLRAEIVQQEATSESDSSFDEPPPKMSPKKDDSNIPSCQDGNGLNISTNKRSSDLANCVPQTHLYRCGSCPGMGCLFRTATWSAEAGLSRSFSLVSRQVAYVETTPHLDASLLKVVFFCKKIFKL